jgi:hypothetical protein
MSEMPASGTAVDGRPYVPDHRARRNGLAGIDALPGERPLERGLHVHSCLLGFDFEHGLAERDRIADRLVPANDDDLFVAERDVGHPQLGHSGAPSGELSKGGGDRVG